jgi:hypothetical protein
MQAYHEVRNALTERDLHAPGAWVRDRFGEHPGSGWAGQIWRKVFDGLRATAFSTRSEPNHALGLRREERLQKRDWERAFER